MANKTLFLIGGGKAYTVYAEDFAAAARGTNACIAVLAQTRSGWEKHRDEITHPLITRGITNFDLVTPDVDGQLDLERAIPALQAATGILICGGHTPTYYRLFACDPIRSIIQEKYDACVPVAGVSAGALISMEVCQLTPDETGERDIQLSPGLGLANGFVVGVHFTERNALPEVLEMMAKAKIPLGYGIDEPACLVCENGRATRALGKSVYRIEMLDFETKSHHIVPVNTQEN